MRAALFALLLASTGCEQILGIETIEEPTSVDANPNATITGKLVVWPQDTGQSGVGIAGQLITGGEIPGAEATTTANGAFALTAPNGAPGFFRTFDETSPLTLRPGTYHALDLFSDGSQIQLTSYANAETDLFEDAELGAGMADQPFARIEVIGGDYKGLAEATVQVSGTAAGETIRYTDNQGRPRVDQGMTVVHERADGEKFAVAYVFGLTAQNSYDFSARIGGESVGVGHTILIPDANTVTTVVIRFPNR